MNAGIIQICTKQMTKHFKFEIYQRSNSSFGKSIKIRSRQEKMKNKMEIFNAGFSRMKSCKNEVALVEMSRIHTNMSTSPLK